MLSDLGDRVIHITISSDTAALRSRDIRTHPELQVSELREYASRRSFRIVSEYTDRGVSGSKESRTELNRLMADAHRRRFDLVLVWKIYRFGGSPKHLVNSLADLAAFGVAFVSPRDNLDLSTPSGRLMFQIIGAMAEFGNSGDL